MKSYSRSHLSDRELLLGFSNRIQQERANTADLLADIAEIQSRRLYAPAGYENMHAYCVGEFYLSDASAWKRIRAARTAKNFPQVFEAIAEGRLNLSAVLMLDGYLTAENADELIAATACKTNREIERLLAERFPQADVPTAVQVVVNTPQQLAVRPIEPIPPLDGWPADEPVREERTPPRIAPLSPGRFHFELTLDQETHDDLQAIQDLIGTSDPIVVLRRSFKLLRAKLEQRKFGVTRRPRQRCGDPANGRHIPARVRREVHARDGGCCSFVSENGHRCGSRRFLELDHIVPVARGGQSTVDNLRLRCRAHNQYEAEQVYGRGFMEAKKDEARRLAVRAEQTEDVVSGLRNLGVPAARARRAAEFSAPDQDGTIEQRMRAALRWLVPKRPGPALAAAREAGRGIAGGV